MTQPARIGRRRTFMRSPLWRGIAAVSLSAATVSAAEAQVAGSFEQLQSLVEPRDRVTVTDRTGQELTGSITSLSPASLTLLVEGSQRVFDEADVRDIRQRRPDSLIDGAGLRSGDWPRFHVADASKGRRVRRGCRPPGRHVGV